MKQKLSEAIRLGRARLGLNMQEAAQVIGCTPITYKKLESKGEANWNIIVRACTAFRIEVTFKLKDYDN